MQGDVRMTLTSTPRYVRPDPLGAYMNVSTMLYELVSTVPQLVTGGTYRSTRSFYMAIGCHWLSLLGDLQTSLGAIACASWSRRWPSGEIRWSLQMSRKTATEYDRKSGIKQMSCTAQRQSGVTL